MSDLIELKSEELRTIDGGCESKLFHAAVYVAAVVNDFVEGFAKGFTEGYNEARNE